MESQPIKSTDAKLSHNMAETQPKSSIIAWFATTLILITWLFLFFAITFFWKKNDVTFRSYETHFTQIQEQLSQYQTKYQTLEKNVTQIQNFIQKKFSSNASKIQISNIHQLIQQAQDSLFYLRDVANALSALTLADKQLGELSSLPIESLHNLLMQNITSLKALPQIDLSNALTQLNSLQNQVIQLPLISTTPIPTKEATNASNPSTSEKNWMSAIFSSLRSFQQLIVIQHLDKPIEPLLPQAQQQYLQHNLQLLLQQAQWALLHHQQKIYQTSLQQIKEIIQQYFSTNASSTRTVMQTINELETINLQPNLPDLAPTLDAIASLDKMISSTATDQKELP
ncbi:MAG: uroporphyrinogen-III C-methyltransferase [Rickettsiella sp.]|nr:uroporphyrinogen-III C-methyltransferase [Rickettsiella sp.]